MFGGGHTHSGGGSGAHSHGDNGGGIGNPVPMMVSGALIVMGIWVDEWLGRKAYGWFHNHTPSATINSWGFFYFLTGLTIICAGTTLIMVIVTRIANLRPQKSQPNSAPRPSVYTLPAYALPPDAESPFTVRRKYAFLRSETFVKLATWLPFSIALIAGLAAYLEYPRKYG